MTTPQQPQDDTLRAPSTKAAPVEPVRGSHLLAVFAGSGIGALIGLLMGLAVSPVVSIIIGALASSLALILGLNDQHFSRQKALRIGSFGFACVLLAPLGIYLRTHNVLAPNLQSQVDEYTSVGYTKEEARDFIKLTRFGIVKPEWEMASTAGSEAAQSAADSVSAGNFERKKRAGVLYSANVDYSSCDELANTTADLAVQDVIGNFEIEGGFWKDLADQVRTLPRAYQVAALLMVRDGLCTHHHTIDDTSCHQLSVAEHSDLATLRSNFHETGGMWAFLAEAVTDVQENDQKRVLLTLKEVICREGG